MTEQTPGIYIVLDLEMTGLNPFEHGVIEVGAIVLNQKFDTVGELTVDLCPPDHRIIDQSALEYNGFTRERIQKGISYEAFCEVWKTFLENHFSSDRKPIIIGQFIAADIAFLASVFYYGGHIELYQKLGNDIIDTKSMANERNAIARYNNRPLPFQSTSLSKPGGISETLGITGYSAHTAHGDIVATREAMLRFFNVENI